MEHELFGEKHISLARWLAGDWLIKGPRVFVIQGFPGVGKTAVAREVNALLEKCKNNIPIVHVEMPDTLSVEMEEFKLEVASGLEAAKLNDMMNEVLDSNPQGLWRSIEKLLSGKILLVIDEFQRCFSQQSARPPKALENFFYRISGNVHLPGRILLISNRQLDRDKWSENFNINSLEGVTGQMGVELLEHLLKAEGTLDEVSAERRPGIVKCLYGNPRAMKLLAVSLKFESLDDLIGCDPELWALDERKFSLELLQKLERQLLERAINHLSPGEVKALRALSVYRKAFQTHAFEKVALEGLAPLDLRSNLISRFLIEHHTSWYTMHPIVKEICHYHLLQAPGERVKGHSLAADYYLRFFKVKEIQGNQERLAGHFLEARFHLVQARREQELEEVAGYFGRYLRKTMRSTSPVPQDKNVLNERIAVLSVYLKEPGDKGLEYYLAKLLYARNREGDKEKSLVHAQRATGPYIDPAYWIFRVKLEMELDGIGTAIKTARKGIAQLSTDTGVYALFQFCAELLAKDGRSTEAIILLKQGIDKIPSDKEVRCLYQVCAELLAKEGRLTEAIDLLKQGIDKIPSDKEVRCLYQFCAELLAKDGRLAEAIDLLKQGIAKIPPEQNVFTLYQFCAELLAKDGRSTEAIDLLKQGIAGIPSEQNAFLLYQFCAELLAKDGHLSEAIDMLQDGMARIPYGQYNRHMLERQALYLCCSHQDYKRLEIFLKGEGKFALSPQPILLGKVLLHWSKQEWKVAAAIAEQACSQFPTNILNFSLQAFSMLATGDANAAAAALALFPGEIKKETQNPFAWLYALIQSNLGNLQEAEEYLTAYLGRPLKSGEKADIEGLLDIWDRQPDFTFERTFERTPAYYFPILPPSLTGLAEPVTRRLYGPPVLRSRQKKNQPLITDKPQKQVLVIAMEWHSRHGGLSTFNREFCIALRTMDCRVVCLVPVASREEIEAAKKGGVDLIEAPRTPGLDDKARLCLKAPLPNDFQPGYIIGHDRVTGPASKIQAQVNYPGAKHILFIHTAPQEIEWHKEHDEKGPGAAVKSEERELMQRELAGSAHLVAAVGPQLHCLIESSLRGTANPPPIVQVNPGLRHAVPPGGLPNENLCLLLGRAEDRKLKGLDIAARAMGLLSHPFHPEPVLVVRGAETGEGDQLRELLREISQKPTVKIRVREYTPDLELIRQDIRQSAVVLMPSLSEGFGLSGLEAIAEGIPILVSDRSGLGELLEEILPKDQARNFVIKVTTDLEADGLLWAASIDIVLRDLKAAFNRAEELKNRLQQELIWEKAVTQLLDASDSP